MAYIDGKDQLSIQGLIQGEGVFVRFSRFADGKDFTTTWLGQKYMGIATGVTAPTDKSAYQWQQIVYKPDLTGLAGFVLGLTWSENYNPNLPVYGFEIASLSIYEDASDNYREHSAFRGVKVYNLYGDYNAWQPFKVGIGDYAVTCTCSATEYDFGTFTYVSDTNVWQDYGESYFINWGDAWDDMQKKQIEISRWLQPIETNSVYTALDELHEYAQSLTSGGD